MFNYSYSLKILFDKNNEISELILKILYCKYKTIIYIPISIHNIFIRYICYHELFLLLTIMIILQSNRNFYFY